jgi:hypothetical protein
MPPPHPAVPLEVLRGGPPAFNPIENAFAKLKAILRKAATRTIAGLWDAVRGALPLSTPSEYANYFTAAVNGICSGPLRISSELDS